jgi:hypothetical protein
MDRSLWMFAADGTRNHPYLATVIALRSDFDRVNKL